MTDQTSATEPSNMNDRDEWMPFIEMPRDGGVYLVYDQGLVYPAAWVESPQTKYRTEKRKRWFGGTKEVRVPCGTTTTQRFMQTCISGGEYAPLYFMDHTPRPTWFCNVPTPAAKGTP